MTILALGPGVAGYQQMVGNGVANLTTLCVTPPGGTTAVTFPNIPGFTLVAVKTVTGDPGLTVQPGSTILGEQVAALPFAEALFPDTYILGPFFTLDENVGTALVQLNITTLANLSGIGVIQSGGVY
jgi:hypothetical protein